MLKQGPDSTWRVSLRSLGAVDVRQIAERQGGGGHRFAAGFTSDESAEAIVAQILARAVIRTVRDAVDRLAMRDGLVVVDKAPGWTSHDVVAKLRGVYGQRRVGHAGTLDPDATGVLLVGLGRVTRLLRYLQEAGKEYRGRVVFGVATDTLDASGAVLERTEMPVTRAEVDAAARAFVGDIEQVPPMVSALKVGGRALVRAGARGRGGRARGPARAHRRARRRGPRSRARTRRRRSGSRARAAPTSARSRPTSAPRSAGARTSASLRRLRVGSFTLDEARPIEAIEADPDAAVRAPTEAMRDLECVQRRRASGRARLRTARRSRRPRCSASSDGAGPFAVVDDRGALLAVYERRGGGVKPSVVLRRSAIA